MQSIKHLKKRLLLEAIPIGHVFSHALAQGVTFRRVIAWTFNAEAAARIRSSKEVAATAHLTSDSNDAGVEVELVLFALLSTILSTDLLSLRYLTPV